MSNTPKLGLTLPTGTDWADIAALNGNFILIDAAVSAARAAGEYEPAKAYAVGDYCTRDGVLYRCVTDIPAGEAWNAGHWAETSIDGELKAMAAALAAHADSKSNPHSVTAAQVGAVPDGGRGKVFSLITTDGSGATQGGTYYGIMYADPDHAESGIGSMRGTNGIFLFMNCSYTDFAKETELGGRYFYKNASTNKYPAFPQAVGTSGQDGKLMHYKSQAGRKVYEQDEIIPMDVFEILDTGNIATLGLAKIATGSYVGTGTYGADNPCSLTFPFVPKLFIVSQADRGFSANNIWQAGFVWIAGIATVVTDTQMSGTVVSLEGNSLSWYNRRGASEQINALNKNYVYIAI